MDENNDDLPENTGTEHTDSLFARPPGADPSLPDRIPWSAIMQILDDERAERYLEKLKWESEKDTPHCGPYNGFEEGAK